MKRLAERHLLVSEVVPFAVSRVFGHISYRSDWELVKVDFRQSFPQACTEDDYGSWQLTDLQVTRAHIRAHAYTHTYTHVCLLTPGSPGGDVHHGAAAELQEEEGRSPLCERTKLHLRSEQPPMSMHRERLQLVSVHVRMHKRIVHNRAHKKE